MEFTYRKSDNSELFSNITGKDKLDIENPQNYIPIYTKFFSMNEGNADKMNLNNLLSLDKINSMDSHNSCNAQVIDNENKVSNKDIFFKFSPLLDPTKYMIGKYDSSDNSMLELPKFGEVSGHAKTNDPNNSAYVDSFFTYLSSQLLHNHNFLHSLDFYGSFLGQKNDFQVNIADEIEYLNDSEFFHKNRGSLFSVDNNFANERFNFNTRNNKDRIKLSDNLEDENILQLSDIADISELDSIFISNTNLIDTSGASLLFSCDLSGNNTRKTDDSSSCSSRSSDTENEDESDDEDDEGDGSSSSSGGSQDTDYSTASEDILMANINQFPVQVIAMEKCQDTLDSLIVESEEDLRDAEWGSMVIQVIMTLLAYQKCFSFTHNDLHTNNIMYVPTEKQYLYYKWDGKHYKVPTFGRLYKIIDFGRAIYKFRGNVVCSDSYHPKGDAATQYNFEPYFNDKKPRLEPNSSFDLCRLGCSLYDFVIDEIEENPKSPQNAAKRLIIEWCKDDKDRNILYKNNGDERYPDFKLYKMIARSVHKHSPGDVLNQGYFSRYIVGKKKIGKNAKIMNIDNLPDYS